MVYERLNKNSIFIFSEDIDLMLCALNILGGEKNHQLCTQIYGSDTISLLKRKYPFLFEIYSYFERNYTDEIIGQLLHFPMESFDLQSYRDFLIDMDPVKFIMEYTNITDRDKIVKAMESETYLESLYFEYPNIFNSYLGFQTFLRETKRIISDFFSLVNELRTETFLQAVSNVQSTVNHERKKCTDSLSNLEPLEFSQKIMGKTFRNRGPYTTFYFMPSLFTPYKAIRFFENDQFLFYSIRKEKLEDEQMLKQLKTIADETRLKIISLLNQKEPLRGMDIGKELSLAQSTVSHHMEQLKNAGLLHEEQVKNSKYYSLSRNSIDELLQLLTETLGKK